MAAANDEVCATWTRIQSLRDDSAAQQAIEDELVKFCSGAANEAAAEQFQLKNDDEAHRGLVGFLVENVGLVESGSSLCATSCRALLALSFSDENNRFLLGDPHLSSQLEAVLRVTVPSQDKLKYNPKMDSAALGKIMSNPDQGLKEMQSSRQAALAQQEASLSAEERRERDLFAAWQLIRRYTILLARNLAKVALPSLPTASSSSSASSSGESTESTATSSHSHRHPLLSSNEFLQAMLTSIGSVFESGEIVYYMLQALRFLFEAAKGDVALLTERAGYLLSLDKAVETIIGTAMTNRVVRKPSGEGLWVHYEACRVIAILVSVLSSEQRRLFLRKHACRALANLVNGCKVAQLHVEGIAALNLLVESEPDAPVVLMGQSSTSRHISMAVLTTLAAMLVRYQADPALLISQQDTELALAAGRLLVAFTGRQSLPKSEDGTIWHMLKQAQGDIVIAAFVERFPSLSDALSPLLASLKRNN